MSITRFSFSFIFEYDALCKNSLCQHYYFTITRWYQIATNCINFVVIVSYELIFHWYSYKSLKSKKNLFFCYGEHKNCGAKFYELRNETTARIYINNFVVVSSADKEKIYIKKSEAQRTQLRKLFWVTTAFSVIKV